MPGAALCTFFSCLCLLASPVHDASKRPQFTRGAGTLADLRTCNGGAGNPHSAWHLATNISAHQTCGSIFNVSCVPGVGSARVAAGLQNIALQCPPTNTLYGTAADVLLPQYASRGAKEFVDDIVPALKSEFPNVELVVETRSGKFPFLEGFYKNGRRKPIGIKVCSTACTLS